MQHRDLNVHNDASTYRSKKSLPLKNRGTLTEPLKLT